METLYQYYAERGEQPTYASFGGEEQLLKYMDLRKSVFFRLSLPSQLFSGKSLLEFGPDTGENSLVFAKWGAQLTLVEPNAAAHAFIRQYFSDFQLHDSLTDLSEASVLGYVPHKKHDIVDAEGFIYTIQPNSAWIGKVKECLKPDGMLIISYMERFGSFMELMLKAIYKTVESSKRNEHGIDVAKLLFQPKWDSINHTRTIESWYMDVIQNPFVRLKYFIEPVGLMEDMLANGLRLYSSWPNYRDFLSASWIKAPMDHMGDLNAARTFVEQSRLSHFFGRKCFLYKPMENVSQNLELLLNSADTLAGNWSSDVCSTALDCLDKVEIQVNDSYIASGDEQWAGIEETFEMMKSVFNMMRMNDVASLIHFCRNDKTFISTWGTPAHYAVFQNTK